MNRTLVAKELVKIARELVAMEFPTQDAYDKYMKEHPDADKSLHSVKETKKEPAKQEKPAQRKPIHITRENLKEHLTFMDVDETPAYFSHYDTDEDLEKGDTNFGISKKEAEQHLKFAEPLVKAVLKKHNVTGDVKIGFAPSEGYGFLEIKNLKKEGKKVDGNDKVWDDLDKIAPWN